jgi:HK97 family phage portal protein
MWKILSRKQTPVWNIIVSGKEGSAVWSKFNKQEAARVYSNIDTVYSCVDMIASGFSQIAFKTVKTSNDGTKTEVFNHPATALLGNPSAMMSGPELLYAWAAWKLIAGDSYLYLNAGKDKLADYRAKPIELNVIRADRMRIIPGESGVAAFEYEYNGGRLLFPVDPASQRSNIVHSKFFNPTDDFYGLSPMQAAARGVDIYEAAQKWNKALLENSCRPSGMFSYTGEGDPGADQIQEIRKVIQDQTGPDNAGKPLFGGKLTFTQMSMTPKDVEFLAAKDKTMQDIARCYKVPPVLLNIGSDATFSNMAEARLGLWDDAIIPMAKCFCNEMNANLLPRFGTTGGEMIEPCFDHITALEPRREMQWKRAAEADFLTINERRNIVGFEDVADGDTILVPASSVPLEFAAGDFSDVTDPDADEKAWSRKKKAVTR